MSGSIKLKIKQNAWHCPLWIFFEKKAPRYSILHFTFVPLDFIAVVFKEDK